VSARVAPCGICGVGHYADCRILGRHLDSMRAARRGKRTINSRKRAVIRMAVIIEPPLTDATTRDVMKWRLGPTVSPGASLDNITHARGFFAWAGVRGLRKNDLAAALPVPRRPTARAS
jgi:hypothetical protein